MEWRNVRQCAELGKGRGGSDDWGSSHMPGMSEVLLGRWTRRMPPSHWFSKHQISFLTWRVEFVAGPGGDARRSIVLGLIALRPDCCVTHHFRTGHIGQRGSRGTHTVAPSSIMA